MLELCLVRHGQTACSVKGCYCGGGCDVSLTNVGLAMADAVATRLASTPWKAIYSSPLKRALESARPLVERRASQVREMPELRELDYGRWDGRMPEELRGEESKAYAAWLDDPATVAPPGGETARAVAARATAALETIKSQHASGPVVVFSHKCTIRILTSILLGSPLRSYRRQVPQPLAALTVFEIDASGAQPVCLGDVSHLPEDLRAVAGG
ncbi:MAG: histidine phosphatase family protein [Myxococcota bacterium]